MMPPEVHAQVADSRRRQGLPETVQDPGVLNQLAAALWHHAAQGPVRHGVQVEGVAPDAA